MAQALLTKYGQLVFSRGVNDMVAVNSLFALHVIVCLQRHGRGDWGDVSLEDKLSNDRAAGDYKQLVTMVNRAWGY